MVATVTKELGTEARQEAARLADELAKRLGVPPGRWPSLLAIVSRRDAKARENTRQLTALEDFQEALGYRLDLGGNATQDEILEAVPGPWSAARRHAQIVAALGKPGLACESWDKLAERVRQEVADRAECRQMLAGWAEFEQELCLALGVQQAGGVDLLELVGALVDRSGETDKGEADLNAVGRQHPQEDVALDRHVGKGENPQLPDEEIAVLARAVDLLEHLDENTRGRVMRYLVLRYDP